MTRHLARWVILQSILAAGIAALFVSGGLERALSPEMLPYCAGLAALTGIGLLLIACGRLEWPRWLAGRMTWIAIIGTVAGLSQAVMHAQTDHAAALVGVGTALLSTAFGAAGGILLSFNLKMVAGKAEDE